MLFHRVSKRHLWLVFLRSKRIESVISTNAIFLEDDYIMNQKPKRKIDLREIGREPSDSLAVKNNVRQENATSSPISALVPHHSERIVSQPDRCMFLGEAFQAVSIESETDRATYEEAMTECF